MIEAVMSFEGAWLLVERLGCIGSLLSLGHSLRNTNRQQYPRPEYD